MSDDEQDAVARETAPPGIDITTPSVARVYDFMLQGKDNYASDRRVAEMALKIAPDAPAAARAGRRFLRRAVRYMASEAGIRQFLDIGSGLPTQGNVHEIAKEVAPRRARRLRGHRPDRARARPGPADQDQRHRGRRR
ncbi:SAM-dependent methyltransferase [Thermocatellispora tengchongensis]|uniref:SAM-dependent methyltransferase n=1 Tax=Thermocatellispora tengchongensis TaxID=1073253 RepID=UPI003629628C